MKWIVEETRYGYMIVTSRNQIITGELSRDQAQAIAAAHNAVIDMAFDSPGNVS